MLLILLLVLIGDIYLASKTKKGVVFKSLLLAFVLGTTSILLFELLNGPHAECGVNSSVGPCNLTDRLWYDAPFIFIPTIFFWTLILILSNVASASKLKIGEKK